MEDNEGIRMLGCWLRTKEDGRNRRRRALGLWHKVKAQLRHTKISKRMQARIVEACVESGILFACAVRTWWVSDVKKLHTWIDCCYCYVWSNQHEPQLMQMQRERGNMEEVNNGLGAKSFR